MVSMASRSGVDSKLVVRLEKIKSDEIILNEARGPFSGDT